MPPAPDNLDRAGLCAQCAHVRIIVNDRGAVFYQCRLASTDPSYAPYPRLPRLECKGFEPGKTPAERTFQSDSP